MEDNQARLCPKCGTPLMEDNFCMGCGTYVDPDNGAAKGKDSVIGYGESDSFGSFGMSPSADPTGIIGESGASDGYGAGSGNNAAGGYGTVGYGTTGGYGATSSYGNVGTYDSSSNYGNAGTYDSSNNYGNAGGYNAAGNYDNAGGYNASGNYGNGGDQNGNFGASAARGYSNKPSFLASVLIMAGIACAVFLAIFVTDTMTKLKQQTAKYVAPEKEAGVTEYWQVDYKGDEVLEIKEVWEFSFYGESDADIGVRKGGLEDKCQELFGAYPTISYEVTSSGSTVSVVITYGNLNKRDGMQAMVKAANVSMSKDADHISAKSVDKSLLKNGWKKR